ncbi:MAG: glycosyltransferase, partial [bacterium]
PSFIENEKKSLGIPLSVPVVCYVGAIRPWQGLEILVESASMIRDELGDVRFLIVGGGEWLSDLKAAAEEKGLRSVFTFTGSVPYERVPLMIALSDVCVAPFVRGRAASPMKVYEYMASGKPVVASRIPGLGFIAERKLGLLVTPETPEELARAAVRILREPSSAGEIAARARKYVRENCSWPSVARRIMSLVREF